MVRTASTKRGFKAEPRKTHETLNHEILKKDPPRSLHYLLSLPTLDLRQMDTKRGSNSNHRGKAIKLTDCLVWSKGFPNASAIEALWADSETLKREMYRGLGIEEAGRCTWEYPIRDGQSNEQCLEREMGDIHKRINLASEMVRRALFEAGEKSTISYLNMYIKIGDGQSALMISPFAEKGAEKKKPDYAAYAFHHDGFQYKKEARQTIPNRIPGDAKVFRKIRHEMLPPAGALYTENDKNSNVEVTKVLSQIHGYMDSRGARYGYVVNNEELIFFRRRNEGWGHLDISPPIRHDIQADLSNGVVNSVWILFYFHFKVACDDDPECGWHLESFANTI